MIRAGLLGLGLGLLALPALAEQVVLGLSRDRVQITTTFDGSDILIFGAVKREAPAPEDPMDVVISVQGPSTPVTVRRKSRRFGIWINTDTVEVGRAPSFFAIATTSPIEDTLLRIEDMRERVSLDRAISGWRWIDDVEEPLEFLDALKRIRFEEGRYTINESSIAFDEETLFRTSIRLPANLTEGGYLTRIFLTREGRIVSSYETVIDVHKVGLERWLYSLSREQPLIYGLMSLALAIFAGWGASELFRAIRRA
ncbi:TIGR02186 family protein [Poseidonocella sedimentorum]|uniref:Transmembrane protein (Alph_Pro_TM) n=1 Tax=Poseidonocella sedimentorum TaxID=871652 RepID=A0A1I6DS11_9RHOB|nr:TIGR02186 family protein [Poseidonocella sedimentorum]SFR08226.1 conserved hypothetical protein [Poseidonocella sedimentorum]